MKSIFEQNGGTYTQVGDYLIPNISLPDAPAYPMRSGIKEQTGAPIQEKVYVDSLKEAENSLTIHESQLSNEQEERKKNGQKER